MKQYGFTTVGRILKKLEVNGLKLSRGAFYRLEEQELFTMSRTIGKWRTTSAKDEDIIVNLILENYGMKKIDK